MPMEKIYKFDVGKEPWNNNRAVDLYDCAYALIGTVVVMVLGLGYAECFPISANYIGDATLYAYCLVVSILAITEVAKRVVDMIREVNR